jgi:hypothetical protein
MKSFIQMGLVMPSARGGNIETHGWRLRELRSPATSSQPRLIPLTDG